MKKAHFALAGVLLIGLVAVFFSRDMIGRALSSEPRAVVAHVSLRNNCALPDQNFVVKDLATNRTTRFAGGVARVNTYSDHALILHLAAKYDGVQFNGTAQRAKARMTLTADCDSSEKEAATMKSLRKSLGGN